MKTLLLLLLLPLAAFAQDAPPMKVYWVFLVRGANRSKDAAEGQKFQNEHIGNFKRLFGEQKLIAAGPLGDPTQYKRGIVILTVKKESEVKECFKPDPYVQNGIMNLHVYPMTVEFGRIETVKIDPEGIEENRLVLFSLGDSPSASRDFKDGSATHLEYIKGGAPSGLAFYGSVSKGNYRGFALFRGKDDAAIEKWLSADPLVKSGALTFTKIPQWLGKGFLGS